MRPFDIGERLDLLHCEAGLTLGLVAEPVRHGVQLARAGAPYHRLQTSHQQPLAVAWKHTAGNAAALWSITAVDGGPQAEGALAVRVHPVSVRPRTGCGYVRTEGYVSWTSTTEACALRSVHPPSSARGVCVNEARVSESKSGLGHEGFLSFP